MKIFSIYCVIVLASSSSAFAQTTSPAPVDLSYHFTKGTVLHYHRLDEFRNPDNPPGYIEGNFDSKEDIHITVESVDALGNATLRVAIEESHDFKGGDDASGVKMGGLADDIPLYRVTVDRFGTYLNGEILKNTPLDSMLNEKKKNPKFNGSKLPDSSLMKLELSEEFCSRPSPMAARAGLKWGDSTFETVFSQQYSNPGSTTPSAMQRSVKPTYRSRHYDYAIVQNAEDRSAGVFHLNTLTTNYQVAEGMLLSEWTNDEHQDIRTSDGLTTLRTRFEHRIGGVSVNTSTGKRTLTLVGVDSTDK